VAAGIIPGLLPAIVNAVLTRGALLFSKNTAIVQRPDSVQKIGVFSVLCIDKVGILPSTAWLPVGAMSATQLLVQNPFFAISMSTAWDNVDEEYFAVPRPWRITDTLGFIVLIGPGTSTIDLAIFLTTGATIAYSQVLYAYQGHRGIPVRFSFSKGLCAKFSWFTSFALANSQSHELISAKSVYINAL
jgi:hypothetical protein